MKLQLKDKRIETPGCISFILESQEPLNWQAGQFMRYHLEDTQPDERGKDRYFTIASAPFENKVMITTRINTEKGSTFKKDLNQLQIGETIEASGPMGSFVIDQPYHEYVFIAGGIGITPFRSILLDLDHHNLPLNITLLYANRDTNIVFQKELEKLQEKYPLFNIYYFIDPQKITASDIKNNVPHPDTSTYFISGPEPMVKGIEEMLQTEVGITKENIKHDYFPGYSGI